jgi:hypothetical protein
MPTPANSGTSGIWLFDFEVAQTHLALLGPAVRDHLVIASHI